MQYINADICELGSFEEATNGFSFFGLYRDLFFGRTNVMSMQATTPKPTFKKVPHL